MFGGFVSCQIFLVFCLNEFLGALCFQPAICVSRSNDKMSLCEEAEVQIRVSQKAHRKKSDQDPLQ